MARKKKKKKKLAPEIIATLGADDAHKLRKYLFYLYEGALQRQDYKALGCIRGMYNQLWTLSQLVKNKGYRLPPKRPKPRKVAVGQLCLFE
jgi:hypothetical protein